MVTLRKLHLSPPGGVYEWLFMPMGLMNAGATFQYMMEELLASVLWKYYVVYLDDVFSIVIAWRTTSVTLMKF